MEVKMIGTFTQAHNDYLEPPQEIEPREEDLIFAYKEMLLDLEQHKLKVELAPAPERKHLGHCIRVAVGMNPDWYRCLCKRNMRKGRGRRKEYTVIVRGYIKKLLEKLSNGIQVDSKYSEYLAEVAAEKAVDYYADEMFNF
jgi:hypothetical protein